MKRYGNLYEKVIDRENVRAAVLAAARRKRARRPVKRCLDDLDGTVESVRRLLEGGFSASQPTVRAFHDQRRGKDRVRAEPRFYPDQIVHHAVMQVLMPCIARGMSDACMACVPGRGAHRAVHRVERWLREDRKHTRYCLQVDIRRFYESIPRDRLMARLGRLVKDERVIGLVSEIVKSCPGDGLPLGYYTSAWLANLYLQDIDHAMTERWGAAHYVRYADDMLVFGPNKRKLHRLKRDLDAALADLGLEVKGNWQVYKVDSRPIDFVGYKIRRGYTQVRSRTFIRETRSLRKIGAKRVKTVGDAQRAIAIAGVMSHASCDRIRRERIDRYVSIDKMKEIVRNGI